MNLLRLKCLLVLLLLLAISSPLFAQVPTAEVPNLHLPTNQQFVRLLPEGKAFLVEVGPQETKESFAVPPPRRLAIAHLSSPRKLTYLPNALTPVCFSESGKYFATSSGKTNRKTATVLVWSMATLRPVKTLPKAGEPILFIEKDTQLLTHRLLATQAAIQPPIAITAWDWKQNRQTHRPALIPTGYESDPKDEFLAEVSVRFASDTYTVLNYSTWEAGIFAGGGTSDELWSYQHTTGKLVQIGAYVSEGTFDETLVSQCQFLPTTGELLFAVSYRDVHEVLDAPTKNSPGVLSTCQITFYSMETGKPLREKTLSLRNLRVVSLLMLPRQDIVACLICPQEFTEEILQQFPADQQEVLRSKPQLVLLEAQSLTEKERFTVPFDVDALSELSVSSDGQVLQVPDNKRKIHLWNIQTKQFAVKEN